MNAEDVEMDTDTSRDSDDSCDVMKARFKYFKRRKPPPDFSQVIDFDKVSHGTVVENVVPYQLHFLEDQKGPQECGLKNPEQWKAYAVTSHPGLIFVCNPFTAAGQRYWAGRCIRDLPGHPNKTNLDAQGLLTPGDQWWKLCQEGTDWSRLKKLRWVTLGFHHNWDSKLYNMCDRSAFPADLSRLSALVARAAGWPDYSAEAAIVNFYHADSTLAPHTDHSEWDMTAPLLSLSFGQTAIFLLGGQQRSDPPVAMFVRSGDVIIMGGQCRLSYHGVARILPATDARWHDGKRKLHSCCDGAPPGAAKQARRAESDAEPHRCGPGAILCECGVTTEASGDVSSAPEAAVVSYLGRSRINVNVRQVFPRGRMLPGQSP